MEQKLNFIIEPCNVESTLLERNFWIDIELASSVESIAVPFTQARIPFIGSCNWLVVVWAILENSSLGFAPSNVMECKGSRSFPVLCLSVLVVSFSPSVGHWYCL